MTAEVVLSLDGQTEGPVEVVQGQQVQFEVDASGCDSVVAFRWRYTWSSGDGAEESSGTTQTSPCDAAPLTYTHTYSDTGDYTASFEAERCNVFFFFCWNWETFDTDQIDVTVTLNPASFIYNYRFDDESWDGTPGEVVDYSGNELNGTAIGAETDNSNPARAGDPGTCDYGVFSGSDRVEGPASNQLSNTTSFSLAAWVRMDSADQNDDFPAIMAYGNTDGDAFAERFEFYLDRTTTPAEYVLALRRENGQVRQFNVETGANGSADPLAGNWVHLAVTYDGNSRGAVLYVNGNEVGTGRLQGPQGLADASAGLGLMGHVGGAFSAVGDMDEVRVADGVLTQADVESLFLETRPCSEMVASFGVSAPAQASVCAPAEVTVTALNSDGEVVTGYEGEVQLSTSAGHGNWSVADGNGAITPDPHTADDGSALYSFITEDNGEVILALSNERADELEVGVTDSDLGVTGTSDPIQFLENAFAIRTVDSLGDDLVAGREHDMEVVALRRDPDNGECGPITAYDGDIEMKAWVDRTGMDPGGDAPVLAAANDSASMPGSRPSADNVAITFNQGVASVDWRTADVGQYSLNLVDDTSGLVVDTNGDPIPVSGAGPEWTVRPFGFDVTATDNPGAVDATGASFRAAGRDFEVIVRAVAYQPEGDGNEDGQPDGHDSANPDNLADLSDNPTTSAFGNGPALSVSVTADLVAGPDDPADPGLTDPLSIADFADGEASVTANYPEVGSISLLADLGNSYLGRAVTVIGRSGYVGRFHPEHFAVFVDDEGAFADYCETGFVYTGQAFGYEAIPRLRIEPRAFSEDGNDGPLTANYRDEWVRLTPEQVVLDYPGEDEDEELPVIRVDDELVGALSEGPMDGELDFRPIGDEFIYQKNRESRVDPFDTALVITLESLSDGDASVDSERTTNGGNPVTLRPGSVEKRFGRLHLTNTYGPEGVALEVPLETQYWEEGRFRRNLEDSPANSDAPECFTYNPADDVQLEPGDVANNVSEDREVELLMGRPETREEAILLESRNNPVDPENRTAFVTLSFSGEPLPEWLRDVTEDDEFIEPEARATFGVYRGHDRIIHWREVR